MVHPFYFELCFNERETEKIKYGALFFSIVFFFHFPAPGSRLCAAAVNNKQMKKVTAFQTFMQKEKAHNTVNNVK